MSYCDNMARNLIFLLNFGCLPLLLLFKNKRKTKDVIPRRTVGGLFNDEGDDVIVRGLGSTERVFLPTPFTRDTN